MCPLWETGKPGNRPLAVSPNTATATRKPAPMLGFPVSWVFMVHMVIRFTGGADLYDR